MVDSLLYVFDLGYSESFGAEAVSDQGRQIDLMLYWELKRIFCSLCTPPGFKWRIGCKYKGEAKN